MTRPDQDLAPSPVRVPTYVQITPGPALLQGIDSGPDLSTHRVQYGDLPQLSVNMLMALLVDVRLRGRGGAGFLFATKLAATAAGKRPVVVVNLSEGEPASAKDTALALARPHLILDGAVVTARALRARDVHVVVPRERPMVVQSMRAALNERSDDVRMHIHIAEQRFVAGQSAAVVELLSGRPNLPVTTWTPTAVAGYRGRPTLLSNAETWAQIGQLTLRGVTAYKSLGLPLEPGTTLLTLASTHGPPQVVEVPFGTPLKQILNSATLDQPVLIGGFHGSWADRSTLEQATVSVDQMKELGVPLGAGVLLQAGDEECPVQLTSRIVNHLAAQSSRRCGPCFNGLPALAASLEAVLDGRGGTDRLDQLSTLVAGRGACAHPDGTVRLVRSLLAAFPEYVATHAARGSAHCGLRLAS